MSTSAAAHAKRFLVERVLAQAKLDQVTLTEVEVRMLGFAEESASAEDMKAAAEFERGVDDVEYEAKIAKLIQRAYKSDKEGGKEAAWDGALTSLEGEDIYLLVMIEKAGIEGSTPFPFLSDWRFLIGMLPTFIFVGTGIVIAFTPLGARLIRDDRLRLVLFLILLGVPLFIAKIGRRRTGETR